MELIYKINTTLTAQQVATLYQQSGLNRPTEPARVQKMIDNANLIITAWDGEMLVGFLRAFTDYTFDCYLNDLAVHQDYQKRGIGKKLLDELTAQLEEDVAIIVVSSKNAKDFYAKQEFKNFNCLEDTWYKVTKKRG